MYASYHGTSLRVLQRTPPGPGFSIPVSVDHDCIQLLLLDVSRARGRLSGPKQAGCDRPRSSPRDFREAARLHYESVGSLNAFTNITHPRPSRTEWHHVCQAYSTTGTFRPHVDRAIGHAGDGETGDEGRQRQQGTHARLVCLYFLWICLTRALGIEPDTGRTAARAQVYRQRHVRIHECDVFGADACGGNRRQYCTERSGNARKGACDTSRTLYRYYLRRSRYLDIQAIAVIDTTEKWGGRVVYGDTDSVFIYLKGKTKEQAFKIGYEIADTITAMNPAPIKLKFEKVSVSAPRSAGLMV